MPGVERSSWHEVQVGGRPMPTYLSIPEGDGPFPAIVVIQHRGGVDAFTREMADRLAAAGFLAAAPELYHRDGPDCPDPAPVRRQRLRDENVIEDVNATVGFLQAHPLAARERLGIIGFCMGGRMTYLMAAVNGAFNAAVAYYGGGIFVPEGDGPSPFERSAGIGCPLLFHFGAEDRNPSPDDMRRLDAGLTRLGKRHEFHSYPGAGHAFMNRRAETYRAHADTASWPRTTAFLEEHLAPKADAALRPEQPHPV